MQKLILHKQDTKIRNTTDMGIRGKTDEKFETVFLEWLIFYIMPLYGLLAGVSGFFFKVRNTCQKFI